MKTLKKMLLRMSPAVICMKESLGSCAETVKQYIPDPSVSEKGMTLWQTIRSGGSVMVVLGLISVIGVALIIYYFITIKSNKLLPSGFIKKIFSLLKKKNFREMEILCSANNNLVSNIAAAGISHLGSDREVIKEAIQDEGKRSVEDLYQKLSYLADIAAIAPMLGLLGTVLGMIQAFNVIVFQAGAVKPVLLASGISKAMITTATGLIIAIPAMILYSYFRGTIRNIASRLEDISTEVCFILTEKNK